MLTIQPRNDNPKLSWLMR